MNTKKEFDKKVIKKINDIDEAISSKELGLTEDEKKGLEEAKSTLQDTKKASDNAEEYFEKLDERNEEINKWKEETEYEYIKNIDIINGNIDSKLRNTIDKWYETFEGVGIVNRKELNKVTESIKYDNLLMKEVVELETELKRINQDISGQEGYCIVVDYRFRMDENMSMHKVWKFDTSDIIRSKRMDWLFE